MTENPKNAAPSTPTSVTPDRGVLTDPNPGERSSMDDQMGVPPNSLGVLPARGNRAGGGQQLDTGARVGVMRNTEFTAGGRAHRLITGSYGPARPTFDPKSGSIHLSASNDDDATLDPFSGGGNNAITPKVEGAGATNDTTTGEISPARRRDTRTT